MVATTVTPLIVRVVFLLKIGRSCFYSCGVRRLIISEFDGTFSSWCLPAVLIFRRFRSSRVGFGISISVVMISRRAKVLSGKVGYQIMV
jgi:hypothetical protein